MAHCESLGWAVDRPLVVVVAELDPDGRGVPPSDLELRPVQDRFAAAWQTVVRGRDPHAPVVGFTQEVVALLGVPRGGDPDRAVRAIVREVSGDGGGGRRPFSTGVSRVVGDPSGLPAAYEQARRAVVVGRQVHGPGAVAHFDGLGSYRVLSLVADPAELRGFVGETLRELARDDDPELADLRHTLQVLLDHNLNVAERGAGAALPLQHAAVPDRQARADARPVHRGRGAPARPALALKVLQMRGVYRGDRLDSRRISPRDSRFRRHCSTVRPFTSQLYRFRLRGQ